MFDPLQAFDYEELHAQRVVSIKGTRFQRNSDGAAQCDSVAFCLERDVLLVSVDVDTDEVVLIRTQVSFVSNPDKWKPLEILKEYVGKELGWCWIGRNYLGYADTLTLSFSGIEPQLVLCAMASSLRLLQLRNL